MVHTYNLDGWEVYTPSNRDVSRTDLDRATKERVKIEGAYFFSVNGDREVCKETFNEGKINKNQQGLMIQLPGVSLPISGLERITSFLVRSEVLGQDLSALREKSILKYTLGGMALVGVGLKKTK